MDLTFPVNCPSRMNHLVTENFLYTGVLIYPKSDPGRKQTTETKTYNTIPRFTAYKQKQYISAVCMP